jgi:hypothetical protein
VPQQFRRTAIVGAAVASLGACAHESAPACPAGAFDAFVTRFAEDVAVQRAFTDARVTVHRVQDGPVEPVTVTELTPREALRYPLLPSVAARSSEGLRLETRRAPSGAAVARLFTPDTDHQVDFVFRRNGACWSLKAIDDQSL